jgi:Na+-transporting NADH:ubiquinone oxidoreductase subunit B
MNILNPALTARAFLFLLIQVKCLEPSLINTSTDKGQAVVAYSGATPLGDAAAGFADKIPSMMESFIDYSWFWGNIYDCLFDCAGILYIGIGSWRIMASVFTGGL